MIVVISNHLAFNILKVCSKFVGFLEWPMHCLIDLGIEVSSDSFI